MDLHTIEIVLTHTARTFELRAARQRSRLPLVDSSNSEHLAVLVSAKDERRAVLRIWKRLREALPVEVLCTVLAGSDGAYRMSIPIHQGTEQRLQILAAVTARTPEQYLQMAIAHALARDHSTPQAQLTGTLSWIFRESAPEEVTAGTAQRITSIHTPTASTGRETLPPTEPDPAPPVPD